MSPLKYKWLLITMTLLLSTPTFATEVAPHNPFNLISESTLTKNYNANIQDFWANHARSSEFKGIDNKRIHTISIETGNDKAVVISQGRNESVLKYKEVAYDFHLQGYDVFLIDHRGQGFSERFGGDQHRGYVNNFQDYVDDLNQYVNSLALSNKYSHRFLLSHSMGGTINALYLQQYEHPFQASIFYSPMLSINLGGLPTLLAKAITHSSVAVCGWFSDKACYVPGGKDYRTNKYENNPFTHSETRFYSSQIGFELFPETQLGSATMRWLATSLKATEQAINNAHKIDIPILIFEAGIDSIVTAKGQKALFKNVTNCKLNEFITIEGSKHEILLERDEYRLITLTKTFEFLTEIAQGKPTCIK